MCDECGYPGDRHYVLGVAYPANRVDGHGEFMTADSVWKSSETYMADGGMQIGLSHTDGTVGHGKVIHTFVWPDGAPDWETVGADGQPQVIKSGDWLIGVLFDAETWPLLKAGKYNGWSIQGMGARRESETPS